MTSIFTSAVGSARTTVHPPRIRPHARTILVIFMNCSFREVRVVLTLSNTRAEGKSYQSGLSQLYRRQRHRGEHGRDQPKADDHLRLGPAFALEVMMQRGHEENAAAFAEAFASVFEPGDLHQD